MKHAASNATGMEGFSGSDDTDRSDTCGSSVSTLRLVPEVLMLMLSCYIYLGVCVVIYLVWQGPGQDRLGIRGARRRERCGRNNISGAMSQDTDVPVNEVYGPISKVCDSCFWSTHLWPNPEVWQ